jgi:hypothetical protein
MHIAQPLVTEPTHFEGEFATEKKEGYKSPGSEQIPAELIQAGCDTLRSQIQKLIHSILNKEELPQQRKESIILLFLKRAINITILIIEEYQVYQIHTQFYPVLLSQI